MMQNKRRTNNLTNRMRNGLAGGLLGIALTGCYSAKMSQEMQGAYDFGLSTTRHLGEQVNQAYNGCSLDDEVQSVFETQLDAENAMRDCMEQGRIDAENGYRVRLASDVVKAAAIGYVIVRGISSPKKVVSEIGDGSIDGIIGPITY